MIEYVFTYKIDRDQHRMFQVFGKRAANTRRRAFEVRSQFPNIGGRRHYTGFIKITLEES